MSLFRGGCIKNRVKKSRGQKKTSGIVTCMLTKLQKLKWSHCINLAAENGVKKNERKCYHYAHEISNFQNVARASPRRIKKCQNGTKKTSVFEIFSSLTTDAHAFRKMRKKALMLVFFGPFSRFFSFFEIRKIRKKSEKCPEKSHFSHFFLCSAAYFSLLSRYL
jgi:hypothetical protein